MKKLLWLLLLPSFFQPLQAQFRRDYVFDTIPKYSRIEAVERFGDFIYTIGIAADSFGYDLQVVNKLDTLGNKVWGTPNTDAGDFESYYYTRRLLTAGGSLYATGGKWGPGLNSGLLLTKIDQTSGQVLYNKFYGEYSGAIKMMDYDATRLLGYSSYDFNGSTYSGRLLRFSKSTGNLLDAFTVAGIESSFTAEAGVGIFYANQDTVFKRSYTNFSQLDWAAVVAPGTFDVYDFKRLVYNAAENVVFAFGRDDIYKRVCVARINATTGAVEWTYKASFGSDYSAGVVVFEPHYVYVSSQHDLFGGGDYPQFITKLNTDTGAKIWEILVEQFPGDSEEQAARDMTLHNGLLYLTGYYGGGAGYGPSKWGVLCLNTAAGAVVFRQQVPPIPALADEKNSVGQGIFALNNRIVVIGDSEIPNFETLGTWVEMDPNTGDITRRQALGGSRRFPSATHQLIQLSSGKIISLQQQGARCVVKQLDGNGNLGWTRELTADFGMKAALLAPARGDSFIVAGLSYLDVTTFESTAPADRNLKLYLMNGNGTILKTLTKAWPANYRAVMNVLREPQAELYFLTFQQDGNVTRVGKFTFSGWQGESTPVSSWYSLTTGRQNLYKKKNSSHLYAFGSSGFYRIDLTTFPNATFFPQFSIGAYEHLEARDSTVLACGWATGGQAFVARYDADMILQGIKLFSDFPNVNTCSYFVAGENPDILYLLLTGNYESRVVKFNMATQTVLWSSIIYAGEYAEIYSLAFNPISNSITVCGAWSDPNTTLDWQVFVKTYDAAGGGQMLEFLENNTFYGDKALTILADRTSTSTLVGGMLSQDGIGSSTGFLYFFDHDFSNAINARVFWDVNENGLYDPGADQPLSLGSLLLDQSASLYFNAEGLVSFLTAPGAHQLDFQTPPDWALTTGAMSFAVNTLNPPTSTFFIGLKPVGGVGAISPYLVGEHFICADTAGVFIYLKNDGPAFASAQIKLTHPGGFVSAEIAPNASAANTLSWTLDNLPPGGQWINKLKFEMPDAGAVGDSIQFELASIATTGTTDTARFVHRDVLLCAFDPNDKIASPAGEGPSGLTLFDSELRYTIRFQNTGNFPARNVTLRDTLDADLDAETFAFVAASHPVTSIVRQGNALEFIFREINLPDSIASSAESQGFVCFRVKPKTGLLELTAVHNKAQIFFDFNPFIGTNTTLNTYANDLSIGATEPNDRLEFSIFPNPTTGAFSVELSQPATPGMAFRIADLTGRLMLEKQTETGSARQTVQACNLPSGLYFLHIVSGGRVVAVEKFVKQ